MDTDRLQDDRSEYSVSEYSVSTGRSKREGSRHGHRRRKHHDSHHHHRSRGNSGKNVTIRTPPIHNKYDHEKGGAVTVDIPEDSNWGETATFISATTDATQLSHESLAQFNKDRESTYGFHDCGFIGTVIFACISYMTPIAFVIVPQVVWLKPVQESHCGTPCKGSLISMAFKLLILLVASWAIFFRRQQTSMPRVFLFRALIMVLIILITLTYWLFFGIWILEPREQNYESIVSFADSFTNCLLFVHYLSLVLLELRHLQTHYLLEVIRTTDGERRFYNIGNLSIQRCSVWVLEQYYKDFPVYNPAMLRTPSRSSRLHQVSNTNFQVFDVDGNPDAAEDQGQQQRAMMAALSRRRDAGHNERYYEEAEHERRVRKRKARLLAATEDAFSHIRKATEEEVTAKKKKSSLMDANDASNSVFPALARSLQKYLRTTRQHQHYQIDDILKHLSFCINNDMTPRAFLEKYFSPGPYLTYDTELETSQWELVSDEPLVNTIKDGTVFKLNQSSYSLVIICRRSPRLRLQEIFVDPSSNRFTLHMQSETSV